MEALKSFDPDEDFKVIKPERRKEERDRCPTCLQKIEKPIKRDEIWKVIRIFKMASGHEGDKSWDVLYYPRYMKPAKQLIEFMGSWEWAADAVEEIYKNFTQLGFTVTFETILKHSAEWKKNMQEREPKAGR